MLIKAWPRDEAWLAGRTSHRQDSNIGSAHVFQLLRRKHWESEAELNGRDERQAERDINEPHQGAAEAPGARGARHSQRANEQQASQDLTQNSQAVFSSSVDVKTYIS